LKLIVAADLLQRTYGNFGPPAKTVWQHIHLISDRRISRRLDLPLRNYSDFTFTPVWLENVYSRLLGTLTP